MRLRLAFARLPVLTIALLAVATAATAQDRAAATPEGVAERALTALQQDRLDDFVAAVHPDALKRFRTILAEILDAAEAAGQERQILPLFAGFDSARALRDLDDRAFFVAFYRGVTRARPGMYEALAGAKLQALGHVMEGPDTAHVVYRMSMAMQDVSVTKMEVVSLRRTPDGWAMLLSGDIEGIAAALRQRFAPAAKP